MGMELRGLLSWAKSRKLTATLLVVLTLAVGILIGTVISGQVAANKATGVDGAAPLAIPDPVRLSSAFASIANRVEPAVVNISTTQVIDRGSRRRNPQQRPRQNDPFQDFFDRFFDSPEQGPSAERSLGSGVIVDKKGLILTNHHVVDGATTIKVQLHGATTKYNAKLVGLDEDTDLAVIKIDAGKDLPTATLGNSEAVQVGDWVLAIGSPFGLDSTVTAGIVSAKDRANIAGNRQFQRFIQTDAAINPGNSGGPLVDMAGQVIGINTAIMTGGRGYEGVGFALPSNTAIHVYNQLISAGKVVRGSIGISFNEENSTNPVLLKEFGVPYGMIVQSVEPGSPAAKAGIQPADIITEVNGKPVRSGNDLVNPIAQTPIGQKVRVTHVREGKQMEASITVEDRTRVFPNAAAASDSRPDDPGSVEFGLRVEDLTADRARRLNLEGQRGVLVAEVEPASFAEDIGFGRGDLIVEVNKETVSGLADYRRIMGKLKPGQNVLYKVLRRADPERLLTVFLAGVVPVDSK